MVTTMFINNDDTDDDDGIIDLGDVTSVSLCIPHADPNSQTLATITDDLNGNVAVGEMAIPAKYDAPNRTLISFMNADGDCVHVELTPQMLTAVMQLLERERQHETDDDHGAVATAVPVGRTIPIWMRQPSLN